MDLSYYINSFLVECERRCLAKNTVRLYSEVLYAMQRTIKSTDDRGVKQYIENLVGKPGTNHLKMSIVKRFFNWTIKQGVYKTNPTDSIESVKFSNERSRCLTTEEVSRLLECCDPTMKMIVSIALLTGLRRSAILELKHAEIDIANNRITVQSKGKTHRIPITEPLWQILLHAELKDHPVYLFPNKKGNGPLDNNAMIDFRKACIKAGIKDFRFHDLRHTMATNLLRATGNIYLVQKALGHSSIATTQRYAHLIDDDLRNGLNQLNIGGTMSAVH